MATSFEMNSGADALDAIANAADANRPQEPSGNLFSPRSSAALTLSSISLQQAPQQTLFNGKEAPDDQGETVEVDENAGANHTQSTKTAKDDFCPPKEPKPHAHTLATQKTRRVSDAPGNQPKDQFGQAPSMQTAPLQRSTSAVATPGSSASKLRFGNPSGEARASFLPPPPPPATHPNGAFIYMYPSAHSHNSNESENYPKGNSPDPSAPLPFNHHEAKASPPSAPHAFMYRKPSPPGVRNSNQDQTTQQQQHNHANSVDFQPPLWKSQPNKESRSAHRLVPAPHHPPYRGMPMPAPVVSGGWGEPIQHSQSNSWEQQIPSGTPFIMHHGQLYPYYPHHHYPGMTVTPTPHKKQRIDGSGGSRYSGGGSGRSLVKSNRPKKSLGQLAVGFLNIFEAQKGKRSRDEEDQPKTLLSGDPEEIIIDQVAIDLEVERRRIYDVVNILEALQVVVKKGKNTYAFKGREHLGRQFALMQREAIESWPSHAVAHGLLGLESDAGKGLLLDDKEESKSLTRLSQLFLHVFLVGFDNVNLPQVSDLIHGRKTSQHDYAKLGSRGDEPPNDPEEFTKAACRGLKTKIRRLYDVANVFLAVGLLRKTENRIAATVEGKRPHYHWNFKDDAKAIKKTYESMEDRMKVEQTPFFKDGPVESPVVLPPRETFKELVNSVPQDAVKEEVVKPEVVKISEDLSSTGTATTETLSTQTSESSEASESSQGAGWDPLCAEVAIGAERLMRSTI